VVGGTIALPFIEPSEISIQSRQVSTTTLKSPKLLHPPAKPRTMSAKKKAEKISSGQDEISLASSPGTRAV
jgi:hypothetical protein